MRIFFALLLLVHLGLLAWGIGGLAEFLWQGLELGLQNPLYPPWLQLAHWIVLLAGGSAFLAGYLLLPRLLLPLLAGAYLALAGVCAVETLFFLEGTAKYFAIAAEYAAYLTILTVLYLRPVDQKGAAPE